MKINKNFRLMMLMAGWAMMSSTAAQASVRDTIDINWGWQFHRGDIKGISQPSGNIQNPHLLDEAMQGCEVVNLPHDFQLYQPWVAPGADERANSKDAANNVKSRLSARGFKEMGIGGGWEMAFIIIGALGFVWLGLWLWIYRRPEDCKHVNKAELEYIQQGIEAEASSAAAQERDKNEEKSIPLSHFLRLPQAWAIFLAKMVTDGVWWFFLFWTPAYISDVYHLKSDNPTAMMLIFVLYAITMLSLYGGKLPTIIMQRTGLNAYDARLKAMFAFTLLPLLTLFAQPLGTISYWFPVILIGLAGASHQAWSANLFSVASDLFPRKAVGTMTGINGMAGGISSYAINKISGHLFDYAAETNMTFLGFEGKPAGYFIIFIYCALAYLAGWCILKALVPHYKPVKIK